MDIFLKDLYGKVVCKSKLEDDTLGKYPRIGWINKNGKRIIRNDVKYKIIKLDESPQFKFLCGEKNYYKEYTNVNGWISGYGEERKRAVLNFENLINNFDERKMTQIDCVLEQDKYVLVDGLHRCSIMYYKDREKCVRVNVIQCRDFISLPLK